LLDFTKLTRDNEFAKVGNPWIFSIFQYLGSKDTFFGYMPLKRACFIEKSGNFLKNAPQKEVNSFSLTYFSIFVGKILNLLL